MTEAEWLNSNDALTMIEALRRLYAGDHDSLERLLWRYYLACCRAIWKLLHDDASREGIVVAEQRPLTASFARRPEKMRCHFYGRRCSARSSGTPSTKRALGP
jgi:hypothetical protein